MWELTFPELAFSDDFFGVGNGEVKKLLLPLEFKHTMKNKALKLQRTYNHYAALQIWRCYIDGSCNREESSDSEDDAEMQMLAKLTAGINTNDATGDALMT